MKRRQFIHLAVAQASAGLAAACSAESAGSTPPRNGYIRAVPRFFPQSVASGDPKPTGVVLWTRALVDESQNEVQVLLQVSKSKTFVELLTLDGATELELLAEKKHDFCLRVRVEGLEPATTYYYRFLVRDAEAYASSRTGRTRTAPASDADEKVRFAVLSCQDYGGRYYHVHRHAAQQDIHFFVHLGDYVYETTADPEFQEEGSERSIEFSDQKGALALNRGEATYYAAQSLDNYRQLYRTVRSDRSLQLLHERYAMIAVWDDHEFSNDAWGESFSYVDGESEELDPERRRNADRAWFEYMPIDYGKPEFEFSEEQAFPDNLRIYRDFRFGRHLHLVMTDLRRYRADHVIAEGAFPGALVLTEGELLSVIPELPEFSVPYVDIDTFADGIYAEYFEEQMDQDTVFGFSSRAFSGEVSAVFINQLLSEAADGAPPPIDLSDPELPRGLAYHSLGKTEQFSSRGSRYFVDADAFELVAKFRYAQSDGESERVMGVPQEKWFVETLNESTQTWKVWGNEFTLMRRVMNLNNPVFPEQVRRNMQISAEDWDGAPNRRAELLSQLSAVENLTVVTGDIHSFFVGDLGVPGGESVIEFVAGAASSATFQSVLTAIDSEQIAGLEAFVAVAGPLLQENSPHLAYQDLASNGFATFEAGPEELLATLHRIPFAKVLEPELDGTLDAHFERVDFRVKSKRGRIERLFSDGYRLWDREKKTFG